MKRLWIFGDSFSTKFNPQLNQISWRENYCKWKSYTPKFFGEILSEELNIQLIECGIDGASNYDILESVSSNIENILNEDIIIIGWSEFTRWRLIDNFGKWQTIGAWCIKYPEFLPIVNNITKQIFDNITIHRSSNDAYEKYINEVNNWIKLINKALQNNKVIHWSFIPEYKLNAKIFDRCNRVCDETKGMVKDTHYSEIGHKELADLFMREIDREIKKII